MPTEVQLFLSANQTWKGIILSADALPSFAAAYLNLLGTFGDIVMAHLGNEKRKDTPGNKPNIQ